MKINENFLLKNIAGKNVVVPVGAATKNLNGMITLKNDSAVYLWECFKEDTAIETVAEKISKEFNVEYDTAMAYVESFVNKLLAHGVFGD